MAASVTVHHKAFGDARIIYLGQLLGCDDDAALGRMARLWSLCTERQTDQPDVFELRACLRNPRGDELLVDAGLGERLEGGAIRVRGCEGMIEWFGEQPAQQRQAGKRRAAGAKRDQRGRLLPADAADALADPLPAGSSGPAEVQRSPASDPDLSLSPPDLGSCPTPSGASSRDLPGDPQQEAPTPAPAPARTPPPGIPQPGTARPDPRIKLNHDAWAYAAMKHAELRCDGIAPDSVPWPPMPAGEPMRDLVERTREVVSQHEPANFEAARETVKRRIDVAVAEAKREQHLKWFTPSRMWDPKSFWRALEVTPEEAFVRRATARAGPHSTGPRGSPPPAAPDPPRKIKTLT